MKDARAGVAAVRLAAVERTPNALADYLALTKPRLNFLVVATSAAGYYLGAAGTPAVLPMAHAVAGTALVAGGAAVLNQVSERDADALMRRTRMRPLPDGRLPLADARIFGLALAGAGCRVVGGAGPHPVRPHRVPRLHGSPRAGRARDRSQAGDRARRRG